MTALLYKYLVSETNAPINPGPVVVAPSWPTYTNYNNITSAQSASGGDVNSDFVFCSSAAFNQTSITNSNPKQWLTNLFYYPMDSSGNLGAKSTIDSNSSFANTFDSYSGIGAHPIVTSTVAAARVHGTQSNGSFVSSAPQGGAIWFKNPTNYTSIGAAAWVQRPVWNDAGTFIAAAMTAQTGASTPGVMNLTAWNGSSVTSSNNTTITGSSFITDYWWIGNTLFVVATNASVTATIYILNVVGTSLSVVGSFAYDTLLGFNTIVVGHTAPDSTNSRFYMPVMGANNGVSSSTLLAGLQMDVSGTTITPTAITGGTNATDTGNSKWACYPLKSNKLIMPYVSSVKPTELFSTNPASQLVFNSTAFIPSRSGATMMKTHAPSGTVIMWGGVAGGPGLFVQTIS